MQELFRTETRGHLVWYYGPQYSGDEPYHYHEEPWPWRRVCWNKNRDTGLFQVLYVRPGVSLSCLRKHLMRWGLAKKTKIHYNSHMTILAHSSVFGAWADIMNDLRWVTYNRVSLKRLY